MRDAIPKTVDPSNGDFGWFRSASKSRFSKSSTASSGQGKTYTSFTDHIHDYIRRNGGDPSFISDWQKAQGGSSWAPNACKKKVIHLASLDFNLDEMDDLQTMNANGFFNGTQYQTKGFKKAIQYYRDNPNDLIRDKKSHQIYQSAMQLVLENCDFEGNDIINRSVILCRTEEASVITSSNVGDITNHLRGPNESHSHHQTVRFKGDVVTMVRVPYSRINGCYFPEREPGTRESPFMGDEENEFTADTHGLTAFVCGVTSGRKPIGKFRKMFLQYEKILKKIP